MKNIKLMRWTLLFAAFMLVIRPSHSASEATETNALQFVCDGDRYCVVDTAVTTAKLV